MRAWRQADWDTFLGHYRRHRNVWRAADLTGIERSTVYRKRKRDKAFAARMKQIKSGKPVCCPYCRRAIA